MKKYKYATDGVFNLWINNAIKTFANKNIVDAKLSIEVAAIVPKIKWPIDFS